MADRDKRIKRVTVVLLSIGVTLFVVFGFCWLYLSRPIETACSPTGLALSTLQNIVKPAFTKFYSGEVDLQPTGRNKAFVRYLRETDAVLVYREPENIGDDSLVDGDMAVYLLQLPPQLGTKRPTIVAISRVLDDPLSEKCEPDNYADGILWVVHSHRLFFVVADFDAFCSEFGKVKENPDFFYFHQPDRPPAW